ncbi:MAG: hypothetical protein I8H91_11090 [Burkholderiales bacterium]|nr:hypothetical protein [Burkholderiales bacterium]
MTTSRAAAAPALALRQHSAGGYCHQPQHGGPGAHHYFPDGATVRRTGKKLAGRTLDGIKHNGFPK